MNNRRSFLSSLVGLVVGGAAAAVAPRESRAQGPTPGAVPLNTVMTFAPTSWRIETAKRMVNENGERWLASRERYLGRNPILIAFDDDCAVEVTRARNHWKLIERDLTNDEITERDECRQRYCLAFYSFRDRKTALTPLPQPRIGQPVYDRPYRLRAWIKNGRRPEWQMSIEKR